MNNGKLNLALGTLLLLLVVCCGIVKLNRRNHAPYITESNGQTLQYYEGIEDSALLKGLRAFDQEDGDLTEKIVVNSKMQQDGWMVIAYEVWDSEHAAGQYTRNFEVVSREDVAETALEPVVGDEVRSTEETEQESEDTVESTFDPNLEIEPKPETEETEPETERQTEAVTEVPETKIPETKMPETKALAQEEPVPSTTKASQAVEAAVEPQPAGDGKPVIRLKTDGALVQAGQSFPIWDYIESVEDDKDDFSYLSMQIVISGEYDLNVPGNYELEFWLTDSDKNVSDRQIFYLTVQ